MLSVSIFPFAHLDKLGPDAMAQWLSYSQLDTRFAGSIPARVDGFFLRKGSKAMGPVS